jgi:hypothetical protein
MNDYTQRPEYVDKVSSRVRVYTPTVIIEGAHHHPPGVRLSDLLRNQATGEKYMLLTDAVLTAPDGGQSTAGFVLINTTHASVILPLEESDAGPRDSFAAPTAPLNVASPLPGDKQKFGLG